MGRIILNEIGYGGLSGPAAGDRIYVDQILSEGTHIADLIVNDITTPLYAPPGAVNDVMVRTTGDYISVLDSHGNGKVDLSDLYSNKQNKLTAGDNIKIFNNTISASKTNVSISPNYNTGVNLCSITIDGTTSDIYIPSSAIAGVSGVTLNGTSTIDPVTNIAEIIVEPNPNDTATDSLTKLKISNTTYAVAATDEKVTQTETTTDADYELLFSETADNTTRTEGSRKSENLLYNPNDITLTVGATTGMTIDGDNGDINLIGSGDTWDGTYTSLKDAIANAGGGGGTSDLDAVELTQAEYDALTPEQKVDEDKIYFIKDGGSSGGGGGGSDTKVTQTPTTSSDSNEYPLLLKHSANGTEETDTVKTTRDSRLTYNPNTNSINASSYNNEALVRKAVYSNVGLRTRGKDSYGRTVNAEYLQEGFKVSRDSTHTGEDLTDAGVSSEIETGGLDNYKPLVHVYNTTYDDDSLDSSWRKSIDISHEDMVINKDKADSNYTIGYSEMTSLQITSEDITLSHSEYPQDSVTPTVDKSLQVGVDDITNSSTWDGSHTSLVDAITNAGGGGGGGASVSLLTKAQYNALTPAQKTNGTIYFVYATATPGYEYRVCKDGQIIVQRNTSTGDVTWWFIGYSNGGNDWAFPQDMQNYNWMPQSNLIYGVSYDSDKVTQNANIGVYNGYAREWGISTASLSGVTTWGVVTNSGGQGQNNPWSDPPDTNTENAIYFMNKKFSSYDISS